MTPEQIEEAPRKAEALAALPKEEIDALVSAFPSGPSG
jgi:hypothetical protein